MQVAHDRPVRATVGGRGVPPALTQHTAAIVAKLREAAPVNGSFSSKMIAYHMGWIDRDGQPARSSPGKLIRPALCLWACQACGSPPQGALDAAAALEYVHNFTLVHDDIQDGDRERRGRETVWAVWGLAQGINAGDALFARAFATLTKRGPYPDRQLRATRLIADTVTVVVEGQSQDLRFEGKPDTTLRAYLRMVRAKTGVLIGASLEAGAVMAGADDVVARRLAGAGELLGIAFQMRDDWLGTWGDSTVTGKSSSGDLDRGKVTFAVVAAYAAMGEAERSHLRELFSQPAGSMDRARQVRSLLDAAGGAELTRHAPRHFAERASAIVATSGLPLEHVNQFREVAEYVADRRS